MRWRFRSLVVAVLASFASFASAASWDLSELVTSWDQSREEGRGDGDDLFQALDVDFDRSLFVSSIDGRLTNGPIVMHVDGSGGGFDLLLDADDADQYGNLRIAVNQFATSISFVPTAGILSDFSLTRITIDETLRSIRGTSSPIPEPSSVVMLLIGGALVASQLRKFV